MNAWSSSKALSTRSATCSARFDGAWRACFRGRRSTYARAASFCVRPELFCLVWTPPCAVLFDAGAVLAFFGRNARSEIADGRKCSKCTIFEYGVCEKRFLDHADLGKCVPYVKSFLAQRVRTRKNRAYRGIICHAISESVHFADKMPFFGRGRAVSRALTVSSCACGERTEGRTP